MTYIQKKGGRAVRYQSGGRRYRVPDRSLPTTHQAAPGEAEAYPLLSQLCDYETLMGGWQAVRKGRNQSTRNWTGAADRVSMASFEGKLERNLQNLGYSLWCGSYRPGPISSFQLPKPGGGYRVVAALTVRDRVAQRAALGLVEPIFELHFLDCSYAFRANRGVGNALTQLEQYYAEGLRWVVDADIESFFDTIDRDKMLFFLSQRISDKRLLALLGQWLNQLPINRPKAESAVTSLPTADALDQSRASGPSKRGWLTNGLDWGLGQFDDEQVSPLYQPPSAAYYAWEGEAGLEDLANPAQPDKRRWQSQAQRVSREGGKLGLMLARNAIQHGAKPLGGWLGVGAVLGTAGTVGALAWRNRQRSSTSDPLGPELDSPSERPPTPVRRGIAQGAVLSPLYANIYLHQFDQHLVQQGYRLIRYADDLVIVCSSQKEAFRAMAQAEREMAALGLKFKPGKTGVVRLNQGFKFLGAELDEKGHWNYGQNGGGWLHHDHWLKRPPKTAQVVQKGRKPI